MRLRPKPLLPALAWIAVIAGASDGGAAPAPPLVAATYSNAGAARELYAARVAGAVVYVAGRGAENDGDGLVAAFPTGFVNDAASTWSLLWPVAANNDVFQGLAAGADGVYVAGDSYSRTTDSAGGKEQKGIVVKFPLNGATGSGHAGAIWDRQTPPAPGAFTYGGGESLNAVSVVQEDGQTFAYATGAGQQNGSNGGRFFLTKLNAAGDVVWTRDDAAAMVSNAFSRGTAIVALNGHIYVAGRNDDAGSGAGYLRKYDPAGTLGWARTGVAYEYNGATAFGADVVVVGVTAAGGSPSDFLVARWDAAGNVVWSRTFDRNAGDDRLHGVVAHNGRLFAAGSTTGNSAGGLDAVLLEIDPATGDLLSSTLHGGAGTDVARGVASDGVNLYVAGHTTSFGGANSPNSMLLRFSAPPPPAIETQPAATTAAKVGQNVTLTVSATGLGTLTYQWRRNGLNLPGATGTSFTITGASQSDTDVYDVLVSDGFNATASNPARVTIAPATWPGNLKLDPAFDLGLENDIQGSVLAVAAHNGGLLVGGDFIRVNGATRRRLARFTAEGALDAGFTPSFNGNVTALVAQPDHKVVVGGQFTLINGVARAFLVRLNADGSLDAGFNPGGAGPGGNVTSLVRQADGRMYLSGGFSSYNGATINRLARIHADGTLDTGFDPGTGVTAGPGVTPVLALDTSFSPARLLIGGSFTSYNGESGVNRVARLLPTGARDTSFNAGSGVQLEGPGNVAINAIAYDPAGNAVLIGGNFTSYNGTAINRLARLTSSGALDPTFVVGSGTTGASGPNGGINAIALDMSVTPARVVVAGSFSNYNNEATAIIRVARLSNTGALDTAFNPGPNGNVNALLADAAGIVLGGGFTAVGGSSAARLARLSHAGAVTAAPITGTRAPGNVFKLLPLPGGKVLVAGAFSHVGTTAAARLVRLNPNLTLDATFNAGGAGPDLLVNAAVVQGDGKIVIGGNFSTYNGVARNRLARLHPDGTLDTSFAVGTGANNTVNALAALPGGRIFVGGSFSNYDGADAGSLVRVNADGTRDTAFARGAGAFTVVALGVQSDGRPVVTGSFSTIDGQPRNNLARFNVDGSLDASFNVGTGLGASGRMLHVLPDDRLLLGGDFNTYNGAGTSRLIRLAANGALEHSFASSPVNGNVYSLLPQDDGRLLVFGNIGNANGTYLARLNGDGTVDNSLALFGVNYVLHGISQIATLHVLDDGRVLVGGGTFTSNFLAAGTPERSGLVLLAPAAARTITQQPQPVVARAGESATLSVTATGDAPLTYQWLRFGMPISGATGPTFTLPTVTAADAGNYSVQVTNIAGTITSNGAFLNVQFAPVIFAPPQNTTVTPGTTALLTVGVRAEPPAMIQWRKNGVPIPGAHGTVLALPHVTPADAGNYSVVVDNGIGGPITSVAATLAIGPGPVITTQPSPAFVGSGVSPVLSVAASGTGALSYQWRRNGALIEGATNSTLTMPATAVTSGLQAHFSFTGNISDSSGNNRQLSLVGGALAVDRFGNQQGAIGFTSNTATASFDFSLANKSFSLGGWFYQERYSSTEAGGFAQGDVGEPGKALRFMTDYYDATVRFAFWFDDFDLHFARDRSRWMHLFATFDNSTRERKLYVDGQLMATNVAAYGFTGTGPLRFGFMNGRMDEVRVYDRALAGAEVSSVYRSESLQGGQYDVVVSDANGTTTSQRVTVGLDSPFLDESFRPPHFAGANLPSRLELLSDGSFIASNTAANATLLTERAGAVVRYLPDGTRDLAFDHNFSSQFGNLTAAAPAAGKFYASVLTGRYFLNASRTTLFRFNNDGTIDGSFTPFVYDRPSSGSGEIRGLAVQSDGKVLAAGFFANLAGTGRGGIARFNTDGTLDPGFQVTTMTTGGGSGVWSRPVVDGSGRILVGGDFTAFNGANVPGVVRLQPSGALDATFAPSGFQRNAPIRGLVVQSDGRIVLGGRFTVNGVGNLPFVRLHPNGLIDTSFVLTPIPPVGTGTATAFVSIRDMILLPDDKFAAAGFTMHVCNADGTAVPGAEFAPPTLVNAIDNNSPEAFVVRRRSDGGYVLAGLFSSVNGIVQAGVARLSAAGAIQPFAMDLMANTAFPLVFHRTVGGRTLGAGVPGGPGPALDLLPDGRRATTPFSPALAAAQVISIAPAGGGKLVAILADENGQRYVRRILADGSPDPAFTGTATFDVSPPDTAVVQPDGKILLFARFPSNQDVVNGERLRRLHVDGSPDTSYLPVLDQAPPPVRGAPAAGESVGALQSVTRLGIEVLGVSTDNKAYVRYAATSGLTRLARLNPNGAQDGAFNIAAPSTAATSINVGNVTDPLRPGATGQISIALTSRREFQDVEVLPDGKVLVGGEFRSLRSHGQTADAAGGLARFNADGARDVTFNSGGAGPAWTLSAATEAEFPAVEAMVQQPDGRILLAGNFESYNGSPAPGLARIIADGALDPAFVSPVFRQTRYQAWPEMDLQADGAILLSAGYVVPGEVFPRGLVRLLTGIALPAVGTAPVAAQAAVGGSATFAVAATGPGPLTYQWFKDGVAVVDATAATLVVQPVGPANLGHYSVAVTGAGGTVVTTPVPLALAAPASITTQPVSQSVAAGGSFTLSVGVAGAPPFTYQWRKGGTPIGGATGPTFTVNSATVADAGFYTVVVNNGANAPATSEPALVSVIAAGTAASHGVLGAGYVAGTTVTITNSFSHAAGATTALGWQVLLPAGWSFASHTAPAAGLTAPVAGQTEMIEFAWSEPPASPVMFNYTLNVPAGQAGPKEIAALFVLRQEGGAAPVLLLAQPDPLVLQPVTTHSADTDQDFRISLVELTRVIELYNTRNNSVRTGAYKVQPATEDGFAADFERVAGATVTLSRYHSADTHGTTFGTARDGRINLVELTRVIELYNHRTGTTRTGHYHAQPGTEDGFAPGPGPRTFAISLSGASEVPAVASAGTGSGTITFDPVAHTLTFNSIAFSGLTSASTMAHIHGPAAVGESAGPLYTLNPAFFATGSTSGTLSGTLTLAPGAFTVAQQESQLLTGLWYINIHTTNHPGGEIRGQLVP